MFSFNLTAILGIILLTTLGGSVFVVKNMSASRAAALNIQANPSPSPIIPSPSLFPSPTVTPPAPSVKPSIKPSIKLSAKPSINPTATPSPATVTITTTTITTTTKSNDPKLNSLDPTNPAFSTPMTIKGEGFGNQTGIINVYNSNGEAQPYPPSSSWSDTEIKTHSPFFASDMEYQLEVVTADGRKSNRLTVKSGGGQPQLDSIEPSGLKPGDELTIKGSRYDNNPGKIDFFLNYPTISGTGTIVSWSETEIKVKIPSNLEAGKEYGIQVTNGRGGQSSFKYYTLGS